MNEIAIKELTEAKTESPKNMLEETLKKMSKDLGKILAVIVFNYLNLKFFFFFSCYIL